MDIAELRAKYHDRVCKEIIRLGERKGVEYWNFADVSNRTSRGVAHRIVERLGCVANREQLSGQTVGRRFEEITNAYLEQSFELLRHLRPGRWFYSTKTRISEFDQYEHLAELENIVKGDSELASALGRDYIMTPDIVVGRWPASDTDINCDKKIVDEEQRVARLTPMRELNRDVPRMILHASISCKWTMRTDRAQNARTEALNLIRNRKGRLPHVVAATAEPYLNRIASLALGTGDLDCVYHFALYELEEAIAAEGSEDQMDLLKMMVDGRRLRDISDLAFDLAA